MAGNAFYQWILFMENTLPIDIVGEEDLYQRILLSRKNFTNSYHGENDLLPTDSFGGKDFI